MCAFTKQHASSTHATKVEVVLAKLQGRSKHAKGGGNAGREKDDKHMSKELTVIDMPCQPNLSLCGEAIHYIVFCTV
jgi:hypothetical protein